MPRGKKARNITDGESKENIEKKIEDTKDESKEETNPNEETKIRAKRGKKITETSPEVLLPPETTVAQITACIRDGAGSDITKKLKALLNNSTVPRKLINEAVALIFELVEATPTLLLWGKGCIETIASDFMEPKKKLREAFFFPSVESEKRMINHLGKAEKKLLICVFALTNDNLANAIREAKTRGVEIRMIFDDEMMRNAGSDVKKLHDEGFQVRVDLDPKAHMHHKFVVIDDLVLITGSYNWTVQATKKNNENVVVLEDPELAAKYTEEFNKLWEEFAGSIAKSLGGEVPSS